MAPQQSSLKSNPTALGDPISLKSEQTDKDTPQAPAKEKSLKQIAEDKLKKNPSQLGDPISLKAETSKNVPTEEEKGARKSKL